jgi:hypothetical protein
LNKNEKPRGPRDSSRHSSGWRQDLPKPPISASGFQPRRSKINGRPPSWIAELQEDYLLERLSFQVVSKCYVLTPVKSMQAPDSTRKNTEWNHSGIVCVE